MNASRLARAALAGISLLALSFGATQSHAGDVESLPVAAVTIYPGDTIAEAMLVDRAFPAGTAAGYPIVASRAELTGKVARRTLLAGKLIAKNAIAMPALVAQGTIVRAVYQDEGLVITAAALALQSGSLGAVIQVRNTDSGKVIIGSVQADGTVRVDGQ